MMALSRMDENQRALLKKNKKLGLQILGPPVSLDPFQGQVMQLFQQYRSKTHPDRAITLPVDMDVVVRNHILSMDNIFLENRAKDRKAHTERVAKENNRVNRAEQARQTKQAGT